MKCTICNNEKSNMFLIAKEQMFGLYDEFQYMQCSNCGCIQITNIPLSNVMNKYYPTDYYSLQPFNGFKFKTPLHKLIHFLSWKSCLNKNILGDICLYFLPKLKDYPLMSLKYIKPLKNVSLLDVGSGTGDFLHKLNSLGFKNLTGIDPYIDKDIEYSKRNGGGIKIFKKKIADMSHHQQFDLITYNHVFEHLENPLEELLHIKRLLKSNGTCIIRIPIADSFAFEKYKENWVQLDAPRHFFLHTPKSMKILAQKTGFKINNIIYDSTEFQFWGSELYLKNIPLVDGNKYYKKDKYLSLYRKKAKSLNEQQKGDQAIFYLKNTH